MSFNIVIPARYGSTRLPGKPLLDIAGKPMVQRVWEQARRSGAAEVIIATDYQRIADAAGAFGEAAGEGCERAALRVAVESGEEEDVGPGIADYRERARDGGIGFAA